MTQDLFELLAEPEVPPVPEALNRGIHRRLNKALLGLHVVEFVLKASTFALTHFARAVLELLIYTFSGRFGRSR
jgi:hypothetical protein